MNRSLFLDIKDSLLNRHKKIRLEFLNRTESLANLSEAILNCPISTLKNSVITGPTLYRPESVPGNHNMQFQPKIVPVLKTKKKRAKNDLNMF